MRPKCRGTAAPDALVSRVIAARKALAAQIAGKTVYARRLFRDRYGRWIVVATAGNRNLSCTQLRGRFALFRPNWDRGGHIRRLCGK
jgi:micrococcal nuclease